MCHFSSLFLVLHFRYFFPFIINIVVFFSAILQLLQFTNWNYYSMYNLIFVYVFPLLFFYFCASWLQICCYFHFLFVVLVVVIAYIQWNVYLDGEIFCHVLYVLSIMQQLLFVKPNQIENWKKKWKEGNDWVCEVRRSIHKKKLKTEKTKISCVRIAQELDFTYYYFTYIYLSTIALMLVKSRYCFFFFFLFVSIV